MPATNKRDERQLRVFSLPEIEERNLPGIRIASNATSILLGLLLALLAVAVLASMVVQLRLTVDGSGSMEPVYLEPVRTSVGGLLERVAVRAGDRVRKGEVVASIDTSPLNAAVNQLRFDLATASLAASRDSASIPLDRAQADIQMQRAAAELIRARAVLRQRLTEYRMGSNVDSMMATYRSGTHIVLDQALADVLLGQSDSAVAENQRDRAALTHFDVRRGGEAVEKLQSQLNAAKQQRERAIIRAPAAGVVLTDHLERLDGAVATVGEPLLEIADISAWQATLSIGESDIRQIEVGAPVDLEVPALDAEYGRLRGTVEWMASEVPQPDGVGGANQTTGSGIRVVVHVSDSVLVKLDPKRLRRGYAVQAHIVTRRGSAVMLFRSYLRDLMRRAK